MALLPYANRVTTQRGGRDRGERGDRGDRGRADGPPPRPDSPPPVAGAEPDELLEVEANPAEGDLLVAEVEVEAWPRPDGGDDE